jgi:DNA-binding CsgD family transcriptional regulator
MERCKCADPGIKNSKNKLLTAIGSISMNGMNVPSNNEEPIKLTKREIEVLMLVIEGRASKEVADLLYISKRTVDFHLANIYDKLQVTNRVQAFRRAARLGLIPADAMSHGA